jgi:hypothetical protein
LKLSLKQIETFFSVPAKIGVSVYSSKTDEMGHVIGIPAIEFDWLEAPVLVLFERATKKGYKYSSISACEATRLVYYDQDGKVIWEPRKRGDRL